MTANLRLPIAALLALFASACVAQPSPVSNPEATATATTDPAATPSPRVTPTALPTPAAWTGFTETGPVENPFQGMGSGAPRIIAYGSGFEGVGSIGYSDYLATSVAYSSADGLHWTKVELPVDNPGGAQVGPVAASGSRLVAVGSRVGRDPIDLISSLLWVSDDGTTWRQLTGMQFGGLSVERVVGGPGGFLALAQTSTANAIFWSPDGETWTRAAASERLFCCAMIHGIEPFGTGWVAIGAAFPGKDNQYCQGTSWWSPDGVTWHEASLNGRPALFGPEIADGGILATGRGNCEVTFGWPPISLWRSTDGLVWTKLKDDSGFGTDSYLGDGRHLFRLTPYGHHGLSTVASSTDGLGWTDIGVVGFKDSLDEPGYIVGSGGLLAVLPIQSPNRSSIVKLRVAFFQAH